MKHLIFSLLALQAMATAGHAGPAFGGKESSAKPSPAEGKRDDKKPKRPRSFTVGKETTYVAGPLDKDGRIDYPAALNERLRRGVTPQNNANVLLWKAFGPHPQGATMRPEFFKWMGIESPPERGDYFVDLTQFLKLERGEPREEIDRQMDRAARRPWTAKDYPDIARWLEAQEKPLALVVDASKRPQYFSPLVAETENGRTFLIAALVPGVKARALAQALAARAMLRVGRGRYDEAWQDLLACHRLGRLVARGATMIEGLVGVAIDNVACEADLAFLSGAKLDAKRIQACLRDLQRLPPFPPFADHLDYGERFFLLDAVMMIDRQGLNAFEGFSATGKQDSGFAGSVERFVQQWFMHRINWDPALRNVNKWFNRLSDAVRLKDRAARHKQLRQINDELKELKADIVGWQTTVDLFLSGKDMGEAKGKLVGDILITLLMPAIFKVQQAWERAEQVHVNLQIAFALAAYQRDHGGYPKQLDALAPRYLQQVPHDRFSGKPLIYRPSATGYLLYSVGPNGRDDEGRWQDDEPPGDDPRVRMPLPKLRDPETP